MSSIEVDPPTGPPLAEGLATHRPLAPVRVWVLALVASLIAGFASWLIGEVVHRRYGPPKLVVISSPTGGFLDNEEIQKRGMTKRSGQMLEATLTFGSLGAILSLALGLAGGSVRGSARAASGAAIAGAILGGSVGAGVIQAALPSYYRYLNPDTNELMLGILIQLAIASAIGAVAGIAFGIGSGGRRHLVRAALGGLWGAIAGAFVYQMVGAIVFPLDETSNPISATSSTRLFGQLAVSILASAGVAIGVLNEVKGTTSRSVSQELES